MLRTLWCLAFLLVAQAVIADDQPILLKDDSRLQTKITLSLACEPLSLFAETISKATGVGVKARRDIADKNITVFAKDIPVYEAMSRIAQVLDYVWEYTGDTPRKRAYVLVRPLKRKVEAEDLRQAEYRKKDQQFKDGVENAVKMVDADAAAWQKAFDENPAQAVHDYRFRESFRDLACFTEAQREDLWARLAASPYGEVRIPFTELPPSLRKSLRDEITKRHAEHPEWTPSPEGLEQDYFGISRASGARMSGIPLWAGWSYMGLSRYGGSAGWGVVDKDHFVWDDDLAALKEIGVDTSSYKAPSEEHAAPESKTKRVEIKFKESDKTKDRVSFSHTFAEILEAAAEMFDAGIFADDYLCRYRNSMSVRTTFPEDRDKALAELGREFQYEPTASAKIVSLRCKTWYLDEPSEVPKRLVMRWAEAKKKQGHLELKDFVDIARELTNMQINGLTHVRVEGKSPRSPLLWEALRMASHVDRLRLCPILSPSQMKAVSEGGVGYGDMTAPQQRAFAALLRDARSDLPDEKLLDCVFSIRQETKNREGKNDDTGEPMKWSEYVIVFGYTFAPGDEKTFEMLLERKLPKTEKTTSNQ